MINGSVRWKIGLALVALVWGGLRLVREVAPEPEVTTSEFGELAGEWLGRAVAEQFPEGGTVGVMQRSGASEEEGVIRAFELKGLERGLNGGAFTLVFPAGSGSARRSVAVEPREGVAVEQAVFRAWADAKSPPVAVISFDGVPRRFSGAALRATPPMFAFVDAFEFDWVPLMRSGALRACVVLKYGAEWESAGPLGRFSSERVLASRYACVTPESLDALMERYKDILQPDGGRR